MHGRKDLDSYVMALNRKKNILVSMSLGLLVAFSSRPRLISPPPRHFLFFIFSRFDGLPYKFAYLSTLLI